MPEKKGPQEVPAGYRYDRQADCLVRLKEADPSLRERVYPEGHPDGYATGIKVRGKLGFFSARWEFVPDETGDAAPGPDPAETQQQEVKRDG